MNHNGEVAVIGAGGHSKVVIATLQAAGYSVAALYDDNATTFGTQVLGIKVAGPVAEASRKRVPVVLAIGDNAVRRRIAEMLDVEWLTAFHPSAQVHVSVVVGAGSIVFAGAIIQPDTVLGSHVIVNTAASIDHDCAIGDFAHVAPGARIAGGVNVGAGALIGIGSCVLPGISIGSHAVVGAGAAVASDVASDLVVAGVPARPFPR
jgi:sugar O-acyltransferase (sialic acid O-acetyltransferase NeuD family)